MTDRIHLTCLAYINYSNCLFPESIFDPEQGGIDISSSMFTFYKRGTVNSGLKNEFVLIFKLMIGEEGELFYGVKLKRSDIRKRVLPELWVYKSKTLAGINLIPARFIIMPKGKTLYFYA